MTADLNAIRSYLLPPDDSFWKWTEDGEAIAWGDNRTVVFRQELETVLRRQVSVGLPPLGPVVLLLAACRDSWPETSVQAGVVQRLLGQLGAGWKSAGDPGSKSGSKPDSWHSGTIDDLNRVHALPADLRRDPHIKAELVAMVFEKTLRDRTTPEVAAQIVDVLAGGPPGDLLPGKEPSPATVGRLMKDLHRLGAGLRRFDADSLRMRFETGLDGEVQSLPVEEPLAKKVHKLFDQLKNDDELSAMIGLARNLMAVVDLPRPLEEREEIPAGGVSDISNRGTLDTLLMSELAQDDQTLMVRLAMNEALYLRRETPTCNPPRGRLVVLDSGLRLWGVPRVFATSVALSLAAMTEKTVDLKVLRPQGDRLDPVDLSTREGLIEHLKVLRPEAHPGRASGDLGRRLAECGALSDTILITSDDAACDREFLRSLADSEESIAYLITVSRKGDFRLFQRNPHGAKLLREATLDVESLLKPSSKAAHSTQETKRAVPLIDPKRPDDLPAILRVKEFPLRLSHEVNPRQTWGAGAGGVLSIPDDRRLMSWDNPVMGARQITDRLPSRHVLWHRYAAQNRCAQFVLGTGSGTPDLWLVTADLASGECTIAFLPGAKSPVQCVCDHAGVLFVVERFLIHVHDMHSGDHLQTLPISAPDSGGHLQWVNSRFFRWQTWWALSHDGTSARFEEVVPSDQVPGAGRLFAPFLTMFDVKGVEGPVAMSAADGSLYFTADNKHLPLQQPLIPSLRVLRIGSDGHRVCVQHRGTIPASEPSRWETVVVNTMDRSVRPAHGTTEQSVEPNFREIVNPRHRLSRFHAVGVWNGSLLLETRRHRLLWLTLTINETEELVLRPVKSFDANAPRMRPLVSVAGPPGVKYRLRAATFDEGSKLFIDTRGLLHLKSGDPKIPEATFVLCQPQVAVWCADGRMWGSRYYLGNRPPDSARDIWNSVVAPFVSRLL